MTQYKKTSITLELEGSVGEVSRQRLGKYLTNQLIVLISYPYLLYFVVSDLKLIDNSSKNSLVQIFVFANQINQFWNFIRSFFTTNQIS
jgi:hypothetical protein